MIKAFVMFSSILASASSLAAPIAADAVIAVEKNGHFVDGIHEIIAVQGDSEGLSIVSTKGVRDESGVLAYTSTVLDENLECTKTDKEDLLCSNATSEYEFTRGPRGYSVTQKIGADSTILLQNARRVVKADPFVAPF